MYLPYHVFPGPSDHQIKIEGFNIYPDEEGNFLNGVDGKPYSEEELDAIHTYGIVRMTIDLYETLSGKSIRWLWQQKGDKEPLKIKIGNNGVNARFLSGYKSIELDFYGPHNSWIFNCRTVDLIAHETGHAIMNSTFPNWQKGDAETRGMEEAFCDLTAMFLILSQYDLCEEVIRETKGDLTKSSMLTLFGVGHGFEKNPFSEIRNAVNNRTYEAHDWNPYHFCEVAVGITYELLLVFLHRSKGNLENDAESLFNSGMRWRKCLFDAFMNCDATETSLKEFFSWLLDLVPIDFHKDLEKLIRKRNVFD